MAFQSIIRMSTAQFAASNYTLLENQLGVCSDIRDGVETDTLLSKLGPGAWNSLPYWPPTNSATSVALLSSTIVHTNIGTKQALYTVPSGKHCVVTQIVLRNPSADLSSMGASYSFGFNAGASDANTNGDPAVLTATTVAVVLPVAVDLTNQQNVGQTVGSAGDVFGSKNTDTSLNQTIVIDVFGFLY